MSCINPGRVIVAPSEGGVRQTLGNLREYSGAAVDLEYSIEEILHHYDLEEASRTMLARGVSFPFVARVQEGEEMHLAARFGRIPGVMCAVPDFLVRPMGWPPVLNSSVIDKALDLVACLDSAECYGRGAKVAILDTGIERTALPPACPILPNQYDAESCADKTSIALEDAAGHGTLVAYIVNRIAPAACLGSVRIMRHIGTMGSFLAGIYLAEAGFAPDIFNMSLSVSCDDERCDVCRSPRTVTVNTVQMRLLLEGAFKGRSMPMRMPLLVAAAGNGREFISLPAAFPHFIAVGAYDFQTHGEAAYSRYRAVPTDRYILAPGGNAGPADALGQTQAGRWGGCSTLFGTSFSAAFVTGVLARHLGSVSRRYPGNRYEFAIEQLRRAADTSWPGYDVRKHGLGLLRWDPSALDVRAGKTGENPRERQQVFILVDTTGSMGPKLSTVADHIAACDIRSHPAPVFRLLLYGDHADIYTVYLACVSDSVQNIAEAVRHAPMTHGDDAPEALEDAVHFVATEIKAMNLTNARLIVFTDGPPHPPSACPQKFDFQSEVEALLAMDVAVELVQCEAPGILEEPAFDGIEKYSLAEHTW